MKSYKVIDLMVPATDYASVSEDATLYEAVKALEDAQKKFKQDRYQHRGILIYDKTRKIIGKLGQLDILKALEPKYFEMQDRQGLKSLGFSKQFMKSMLKDYRFLDGAMANICKKAGETKVTSFVVTPTEGEFVDMDDSINEAIHQLVLGHHQSLLVTDKKGDIIGILRLTDVFSTICQSMHECGIE
ncbi:MAG: CBS domain-containing protein [Desulfobacteraceae bacterium]|nr:CBS domain-containing protein [Desulfobacteraceae bacterium]MBC2755540.1 CBS domain-containing protein [Desulfobacteraceae bacterium]